MSESAIYNSDSAIILLEDVMSRVAFASGIPNEDVGIAKVLQVARSSPATWRKRGNIPFGTVVAWSIIRGVSLDWVFLTGPSAKEISEAISTSPDSVTAEGLERLTSKKRELLDRLIAGAYRESVSVDDGFKFAKSKFSLVPMYDVAVSAGGGMLPEDAEVTNELAFRNDWITTNLETDPAALAVVAVTGDSMEPTISEKDTVLFDRSEHELRDGIYVLSVEDRLLIKRVQTLAGGTIRITSDNPAYTSEELRDQELEQLNVVGRVVWIGRRV